MKMQVMKCPECRANLEKKDREYFFCEYCGCKIVLDEDKQEININKNINITKNTTYTKRYVNDADVIKARTKEKERKDGNIIIIGCVLLIIVCYFALGMMGKESEKKSIEQEAQLEALVEEIMIDIENNNFEDAYVKANSLYYTADYSSEIEDKWDNTRKAILKQIEAAEKESKGEEKKSFWNIFD